MYRAYHIMPLICSSNTTCKRFRVITITRFGGQKPAEWTAKGEFPECTICASPCTRDLRREVLIQDVVPSQGNSTYFSSSPSNHEDRDVITWRRQIPGDISDLTHHAGLMDPFTAVPTDVGIYILKFMRCDECSRVREVSKEWCRLGNARLALIQEAYMKTDLADAEKRQAAVQFVMKHCTSLQSLGIPVFGPTGYSAEGVQDLLSGCSRVTALSVFPSDLFSPFAPLITIIARRAFRNLVSLKIAMQVTDADVGVFSGDNMPCLRALSLYWPGFITDETYSTYDVHKDLSSQGLSTLINTAPSLTILYIEAFARLTDPFPACRPGIHRLYLAGIDIYDDVLRAMLDAFGADLRALNVSYCDELTNESVQFIGDRCPQLENLLIQQCPLITASCLQSIALLPNLRVVILDFPTVFSDADMDWLHQYTRSSVLIDDRARFSGQVLADDRFCYQPSRLFFDMMRAEGLPCSFDDD